MKNVAGSGGKWLDVSADRLPGWIASFAVRHGASDSQARLGRGPPVAVGDDHVSFTAQDGAVAQCYPPFPPPGGVTALLEEVTPPSRLDDPDVFDRPARADPPIRADPTIPPSSPRRWPLTRAARARSACSWSGSAGSRPGCSPATRPCCGRQSRLAPGARPQRGGRLVAAPLRPPPREAGERGAGRGRRRRRPHLRPGPATSRLDAVVLGGDRRAVADLRDDPRLAPYFGSPPSGS